MECGCELRGYVERMEAVILTNVLNRHKANIYLYRKVYAAVRIPHPAPRMRLHEAVAVNQREVAFRRTKAIPFDYCNDTWVLTRRRINVLSGTTVLTPPLSHVYRYSYTDFSNHITRLQFCFVRIYKQNILLYLKMFIPMLETNYNKI